MVQRALTRRQFIGTAAGLALAGSGLALPSRALTINPRESWATNRPPLGQLDGEDVRFLIVHHSASRNGHSGADAPGILRSFYDYHTSPEKGWNDIAYNFLIDADGGVWEGRAGSLDGAVAGDATGGNQGFSQLVCIIGDYNTAQPTQASLSSLVGLLAWLADRYAISTAPGAETTFTSRGSNRHAAGVTVATPTITGHRTMSQTTCPGDNLNSYVVGDLMADVEGARNGDTVPSSSTPTSSSSTMPTTTSTSTTTTTTTTTPTTTTTTIARPTTTTARPTTTAPSSTTSVPPTTVPPSTTVASSSTTTPVAAGPSSGDSAVPEGIIASAGVLALAGLLLWRRRRMREAGPE